MSASERAAYVVLGRLGQGSGVSPQTSEGHSRAMFPLRRGGA